MSTKNPPFESLIFENADVEAVFNSYSENLQAPLLQVRQLILQVAKTTDGVGQLQETLKWGQVSYLTPITKSGTTIRIGEKGKSDIALFVNCKSSLVEDWRTRYPTLRYEGNRAIILSADEELPKETIGHCIAMALTYHLRKKHT
ncbi:hypothetical protein MNBD_ALPHA11-2400 [hydrothermal vent metagenome]|uniref:YdhG-like domain-containing protein n=1 Tax=hydrothermal vent metagenome TaxID=652676 RepID=A0A3B0TZI2_9ZZZZ